MYHNRRNDQGGSQTFGSRNRELPLYLQKDFISSDRNILINRLVGEEVALGDFTNLDALKRLYSKVIEKRFFTQLIPWRNSYGMGYKDGAIYLNENPMEYSLYKHYVFNDPQNLKPSYEKWDNYRFVHELSHSYQGMQMDKDISTLSSLNMQDINGWAYNMRILGQDRVNLTEREFRASYGDIEISNYAKLFGYCYYLREKYKHLADHRYLTTFANQLDYRSESQEVRYHLGAIEDANELVTMFLWNPNYFMSYMNYLSGEIPNYNRYKQVDNLITISLAEKNKIIDLVREYVKEMKSK